MPRRPEPITLVVVPETDQDAGDKAYVETLRLIIRWIREDAAREMQYDTQHGTQTRHSRRASGAHRSA
jgi:hypothetical protein